jgi:hypothetical protein
MAWIWQSANRIDKAFVRVGAGIAARDVREVAPSATRHGKPKHY